MTLGNDPWGDAPVDKDVAVMSRDELLLHFEWLNFRDELGHSLTFCQDFLDLLERIGG